MHETEMLHDLCEIVMREIEDCNDKIRKTGGELSAGDIDYLDKLTHTLKSVKTAIAMMEAEDDGGYSNRYMPRYYPMSYDGGTGTGGNSYAGRRNARRDSMGRYSRGGGYSYADGIDEILDEMRGMMSSLPEDKRREVQRFVDKMDKMM